jgi:hypothetical protein
MDRANVEGPPVVQPLGERRVDDPHLASTGAIEIEYERF